MKLVVEIDLSDVTPAQWVQRRDEWVSPDGTLVAVDEAHLQRDPTDDSFFLFSLREVVT